MTHVVTSHDPSWRSKFLGESEKFRQALGHNVVAIHHIGRTSILGILAKPIIDVLLEVSRLDQVDNHENHMCELLHESMGDYGIGRRRYFRGSESDGHPAFHVHVFETTSEHVVRHIAFRDYLLAHPSKAKEYSELKGHLSASGLVSKSDYQTAKAPFIDACVKEAVEWSGS